MQLTSEFLPRLSVVRRTHLWRHSVAALLCSSCAAGQPTVAPTDACNVIVQFIPAVHDAADTGLLRELSNEAGAPIHYEHALGGDQHLLKISAATAAGCDQAVTALKQDSRVILAQVDTRKRVHR
jgi:hypothetical protein